MSIDSSASETLPDLMQRLRPRLHRYCARMIGSVFEGEDLVQEAFAKAIEAQPPAPGLRDGERWLFTIAHNTALDALRRRKRHGEVPLENGDDEPPSGAGEADAWISTTASLATLMQLPVVQRSAVVMLDVLEYSLAETVAIFDSTLPAVKAAAHRGRQRLRVLAAESGSAQIQALSRTSSQPQDSDLARLRLYADAFNARDFDKLRGMLADDVRLDLVNRARLAGSKDVAVYFTRYSERYDLRVAAGFAEERPALLYFNSSDAADAVRYVAFIAWEGHEISSIQDFHYVDYIRDGLVARTAM